MMRITILYFLLFSGTLFADVNEQALSRAKAGAKACVTLSEKMGVTKKQLLPVTLFIEKKLPQYIKQGKYYFSVKETGLPFAVEYDPKSRSIFIHLGSGHHFFVGQGASKIVTKSILYDVKKPKILARCQQQAASYKDHGIGTLLRGAEAILQIQASTEHVENGIGYKTTFCKLYEPGRLSNVLNNRSFRLTLKEKMRMALSIIQGLEDLQKRKLIHHDLKSENFLIHIEKKKGRKRKIKVVIADFDLATSEEETQGKVAQYNSYYSAPEAVFYHNFQPIDYYRTDLFAAGCILYRLFYEKKACWQTTGYIKRGIYPAEEQFRRLVRTIESATKSRREALSAKLAKGALLSAKDEFEWIVLSMVHPKAEERPSAHKLRKQLESALKRL